MDAPATPPALPVKQLRWLVRTIASRDNLTELQRHLHRDLALHVLGANVLQEMLVHCTRHFLFPALRRAVQELRKTGALAPGVKQMVAETAVSNALVDALPASLGISAVRELSALVFKCVAARWVLCALWLSLVGCFVSTCCEAMGVRTSSAGCHAPLVSSHHGSVRVVTPASLLPRCHQRWTSPWTSW